MLRKYSPFVCCRECAEPMNAILSAAIRHTCDECGGEPLGMDSVEALRLRRENEDDRWAARVKEIKTARRARREHKDVS